MANYVRRIVHPRADPESVSWMANVAQQQEQVRSEAAIQSGALPPARKYRHLVQVHGAGVLDVGWMFPALAPVGFSPVFTPAFAQQRESFRSRRFPFIRPHRVAGHRPTLPSTNRAALDQAWGGFRTDARRKGDPRHDWLEDGVSRFRFVPPAPANPAFNYALVAQLGTFTAPKRRTRGNDLLWNAHSRSAAAWPEDPREWVAEHTQLAGGFRMPDRRYKLDVRRILWEPQLGWLSLSTFFFFDATSQQQDSFLPPRRKRMDPRLAEWWNQDDWVGRQPAQDTIAGWSPAFAALLGGFRVPGRPGLSPLHVGWEFDGPAFFDAITAAAQWGGIDQLVHAFTMGRGRRFEPTIHEWVDALGWLFATLPVPEVFDPFKFPALQQVLESYRSADGRRLDVRAPDLQQDGWRQNVAEADVQLWIPAFDQSTGGYRSTARRVWGRELKWEPEFSWLRDVLTLPDPPPQLGVYIPTWRPRRFR